MIDKELLRKVEIESRLLKRVASKEYQDKVRFRIKIEMLQLEAAERLQNRKNNVEFDI